MTDTTLAQRFEWLIKKDGYFYRPKKCGYTTSKFEAGRYTEQDAHKEAEIEPWHMKAIHQDEVPDDAPSRSVRELEAIITRLTEANKALTAKAEAALADWSKAATSGIEDFKRAEAAEAKLAKVEAERDGIHEERRGALDLCLKLNGDVARLSAELAEARAADEIDRLTAELAEKERQITRLTNAVEFTARWAWRTDPPNANNQLTDSERLGAIKFHPTIKNYGNPHIELAEREARSFLASKGE